MKKEIKIFTSFEEQEQHHVNFFFKLTPTQRLQTLNELQKMNYKDFLTRIEKKITVHKLDKDGFRAS
jgi:hypothetical protein